MFVPLHEVIRGNANRLYAGMVLSAATLVRLTRDAEVEEGDEDDSGAGLAELVREQVRQRRYEPVVRLNSDRAPIPLRKRCCASALI